MSDLGKWNETIQAMAEARKPEPSDGIPRLKQSVVRMLQRMDTHRPNTYREIQISGKPGAWKVDILYESGHHTSALQPSPDLLDALTLALSIELAGAAEKPPRRAGLHCGDLFGPLA